MNDDLKNQAWFLMEQAEKCNADRVAIKIGLKNRPWTVTLSVDRKYEKNYGIEKIRIKLTNGQEYSLRKPDALSEIEANRPAIFLFDNGDLYEGCSDGVIDEDGDFCLLKQGKNYDIALPAGRLVGWAYKKGGKR